MWIRFVRVTPGSAADMGVALPLHEGTLAHHAARLTVPGYDRGALARGVVHISVGSFHRAHQAAYFDALAHQGLGDGWAITGVGLHRRDMKEALASQDGLYTLVERSDAGDRARVVGVLTRYLYAPEESAAVLDALVDEATRLVTLTITSRGYLVDAGTGAFDADDAGVRADLARPGSPTTAIGFIVEALARRRSLGRAPFTVLSCDNMPANGMVARAAVVSCAALRDERLARWIDEHVTFPGCMVDRITPGTTEQDRRRLEQAFGVRDRWPVMTEPFTQWIVEDAFCHGRPALEEVGVRFVEDVRPYALMKTRLLNGSHCAVGYLGTLAGYERMDEAMADGRIATYVDGLMGHEIAPLLPPVAVDLDAYIAALQSRFRDRAVADRLSRLCRNGSAKVPAHLVSCIREAQLTGRPHALLTLAVAAWCRYLRDTPAADVEDPRGPELQALAARGGSDPRPLLADRAAFGSLAGCPRLARAVERDLRDLDELGAPAVMAARMATCRT
ncbi:MAG: Mannitol dehydrogenase domain protein, partial [Frankiales bacterium]|nr:Mannitol dehydrogenase domain protein [Frankiales bacterium]